jgi:hypothetical protein
VFEVTEVLADKIVSVARMLVRYLVSITLISIAYKI